MERTTPTPAAPRERAAALSITDLQVVYADVVRALDGVTFEVPPGSVVALLGPNGAGKTSVLRAITGLLPLHRGRITGGDVQLDGASVAGVGAERLVRSGVAQVMEGRRIFAPLSVEDNLRTGGFSQRDADVRRASRDRVLELFPVLGERLGQMAGLLSGGEQQMLAIARALMAAPRLLVLDEPSLGLAPKLVGEIQGAIRTINEQGTTVLLVEQNARMALEIADRGVVLTSGRLSLEGSARELLDDPDVQASYLGGTGGR